jgi:hypothetical protein
MTAAVSALMIIIVFLLVCRGASDGPVRRSHGSALLTAGTWRTGRARGARRDHARFATGSPGGRLRQVTADSVTAVLLWIVVSAAFGVCLVTLASYQRTNNAMRGRIVVLVRFWLTNIVVLLGARLDVELWRESEPWVLLCRTGCRIQPPGDALLG